MKRLITAAVLALAVAAGSNQQASAWCKFNMSCGFNICFESTGRCCTFNFNSHSNPPPCFGGGYDPGFAAPGAPLAYDPGYAYPAPATPAPPASTPKTSSTATFQQAAYYPQAASGAASNYASAYGYGYGAGYGYGYGAPAYWYGD
jgi:hypothetical protein